MLLLLAAISIELDVPVNVTLLPAVKATVSTSKKDKAWSFGTVTFWLSVNTVVVCETTLVPGAIHQDLKQYLRLFHPL